MLKNVSDALKIASVGLQAAGQATGNKYLIAAGGATAGAGTAAGGAATMQANAANAANATTPSPSKYGLGSEMNKYSGAIKPPKPDAYRTSPQNTQTAPNVPKPQAELLKVKSTIPKASNPNDQANITKGYLEGLKQSGAKLDNKGQIVKQSGQAFKTEGWDRKAQLMGGRRTPDRLDRLRKLAIDKAADAKGVKGATTEIVSNIPQTQDEAKVKKIWSLDGKSEKELKEFVNRSGFSDYNYSGW